MAMRWDMAERLANLPVRGDFFTRYERGTPTMVEPPAYVCDHDTEPPQHQVIGSDKTNVLIRFLTLKKNKEERAKDAAAKGKKAVSGHANDKGKRPADALDEPDRPNKRPAFESYVETARRARDLASEPYTLAELQSKKMEELRDILKNKNQPLKGRKDELIQRIQNCQERLRRASRPSQQ